MREEVAFGPLQLGIGRDEVEQRIADVMAMLEIADLADRAPYQLSGGQKKRVAIASVLVTNPELILFDEPTAALDPRTQQWLLELIVELGRAGKTIVLATHDLDVLDWVCDRCLVFSEEHRIVRDGTPAAVLDDRDTLLAANLIHPHAHRHGRLVHAHPHDEDHSVIDHGEPLPEAFAGRYDPAMTLADKGAELRRLHDDPELLVMVNVWDVVSAKVAGRAGRLPRDRHREPLGRRLERLRGRREHPASTRCSTAVGRIAAAVDLPVSADLEAGYGDAGETIRRAIGVGVVGANLEDEMQPFDEAVAAVAAAVEAADAEGVPFALNARTDAFLLAGDRDRDAVMADAIERGRAFLDAGATCVFVPGKFDNADDVAAARRGHRPAQGQPHRGARLAAPGAAHPARRRAHLVRPVVAAHGDDGVGRLGRRSARRRLAAERRARGHLTPSNRRRICRNQLGILRTRCVSLAAWTSRTGCLPCICSRRSQSRRPWCSSARSSTAAGE